MKLSLNWIKEFVDLDPALTAQELAERVTLSVCEVEGVEATGLHLDQVVAARVLEIAPHPEADKLCLVTVDFGADQPRQVVCGASNQKVGDMVAFADVGTCLPGDFTIKKAKIRGIESLGMLCAEDELGFSDDHEGLMILPPEAQPGQKLSQLFPDQVDVVLEIDNKSITHRPDLWGHYGFARELAAIYRLPLKRLEMDQSLLSGPGEALTQVEVKAPDLVPRFTGLSVIQAQVCDSPAWLQHRLTRVGLRPINNLVDLTNYVMLELGQPMHAFDGDRIAGNRLVVAPAAAGTKLMTLYMKEVELGPQDLLISDDQHPSTVAGIIGGLDSGVNETTQQLFLEAANWNPVTIRKTSTRIGLRTDASQRFEKALDPELTALAIERAMRLLKLTNPGCQPAGPLLDLRGKAIEPIVIQTSTTFLCKRLGQKIEDAEILDILTRLEFKVELKGEDLTVQVPSHRRTKDISIPEDLVEEVGRIYGFNRIAPQAPAFAVEKPWFNQARLFEHQSRDLLVAQGFFEVYNYPLTCAKEEEPFGLPTSGVMRVKNPVAETQNQMRSSLLPHFIRTLVSNQKQAMDFALFELGRSYQKLPSGKLEEPEGLILGLSQNAGEPGQAFFRLKSALSRLLKGLKLSDLCFRPLDEQSRAFYQHRHISAEVFHGDQSLGRIYSFTPEARDQFSLKGDLAVAELDFGRMQKLEKKEYKFKELSKFPASYLDISVLVPERLLYQEVAQKVESFDPLVKRVSFVDVYLPPELKGEKSLSLSVEFRSPEKTLDSEEVKDLQNRLIGYLDSLGYRLRT